jgi:hypothetical protein
VLGALSVTSRTDRHSLDDLAALAPELQATAAAIARDAGDWRFPEPDPTPTARDDASCPA